MCALHVTSRQWSKSHICMWSNSHIKNCNSSTVSTHILPPIHTQSLLNHTPHMWRTVVDSTWNVIIAPKLRVPGWGTTQHRNHQTHNDVTRQLQCHNAKGWLFWDCMICVIVCDCVCGDVRHVIIILLSINRNRRKISNRTVSWGVTTTPNRIKPVWHMHRYLCWVCCECSDIIYAELCNFPLWKYHLKWKQFEYQS